MVIENNSEYHLAIQRAAHDFVHEFESIGIKALCVK